ncbi:LSM domain eukaryotic/archaea-type [Trinorchestia longiramus]|nr:LSM domain eukaryotic/archaea-type [Trinorchestia longiramus]
MDFLSEEFSPTDALNDPNIELQTEDVSVEASLECVRDKLHSEDLSSLPTDSEIAGPGGIPLAKTRKTPLERNFTADQAPIPARVKPVRNVLTRMAAAVGPLQMLLTAKTNSSIVKVYTRNDRGVRSVLTGTLLAFDKHFNLVLRDVSEVFCAKRRYKRHCIDVLKEKNVSSVEEILRGACVGARPPCAHSEEVYKDTQVWGSPEGGTSVSSTRDLSVQYAPLTGGAAALSGPSCAALNMTFLLPRGRGQVASGLCFVTEPVALHTCSCRLNLSLYRPAAAASTCRSTHLQLLPQPVALHTCSCRRNLSLYTPAAAASTCLFGLEFSAWSSCHLHKIRSIFKMFFFQKEVDV